MASEDTAQVYYPSAKVRLFIRFEEYGTGALDGKAPTKTTPKLKGVKDDRAPLQVVRDPDVETRWLLVPATVGTSQATQETSADGLTHAVTGVIPQKATWKQNGLRTADTLSLTLRYQDLPLDPRVIRACEVQFFLGTVTPTEFAQGIAGKTRGDVFGAGVANASERLNLVADTYLDEEGRSRTNLRFTGHVDKMELSRSSEGAPLVTLECTDNTRLLEKQVRPPRLVIGMEKPIDEAVAEYLSHFPQMAGLAVEYLPADTAVEDIPKLKGVLAQSSFAPNLGPAGGGGGATGPAQETVLDYLTSIVGSVAHSIRIDGTTVIIQRATTLLGAAGARADDPYQGRVLPSGRYPVRAFIYGRNVAEMSLGRDFARKQPKNVEVRSYDPERKNVVVARFPEQADRQLTNAGPGDGKADKNWIVQQVSDGIRDKVVLKEIAQAVYQTQGGQELSVSVKTKNLASFGGGNEDPDLLDMSVGDAFEILYNRGTDQGTDAEQERKLSASGANAELLIDLGFTEAFAKAYERAYTSSGFQREYKMKEMSVDWSVDEGVSIDVTGMNYVVARVDRPDTVEPETPTP